jgi:hypothetical protein
MLNCITLDQVLKVVQIASYLFVGGIAGYGINTWRREAKWKRKYELAEETLTLFYDVENRFEIIRLNAVFGDEGSTRVQGKDENSKEKEFLNSSYIVQERYEREKEPFLKLRSMKFRFMVIFGKESGKPFDEIQKILNDIRFANKMYWKDYVHLDDNPTISDEKLLSKIERMNKYEKVFWAFDDEPDEIKDRIKKAIETIELIWENVSKKR